MKYLPVEKMLPVREESSRKAKRYPFPSESVPNSQVWTADET